MVADDCHITLGGLDAKVETVLAQVRSDRCFVADGRRHNSVEVEKVIEVARCPHGCGCRPTWSHYVFRCREPDLVKMRGGVREVLGEVAQHVTGLDDARHGKMRMMLQAMGAVRGAAISVAEEAAAEFIDAQDPRRGRAYVDALAEPALRAFCGGLIEGIGEERRDWSATTRAAARRMATECGRLLLTAKPLEGQFASEVAERRQAVGLLRKVVRGWRGVVARSGPARIGALAELRHARVAVAQLVGETAGETTEWRAAARRSADGRGTDGVTDR